MLVGSPGDGSARFYPLKVSATSASSDTTAYLALPLVFFEGWMVSQSIGLLDITRLLAASTDTIAYREHSEATWKIDETVRDRGYPLVHGQYWYGASGLLRVEQTWTNFGWREANAANPASGLNTKTIDLHRILVRL